jgi:hypothetical protein
MPYGTDGLTGIHDTERFPGLVSVFERDTCRLSTGAGGWLERAAGTEAPASVMKRHPARTPDAAGCPTPACGSMRVLWLAQRGAIALSRACADAAAGIGTLPAHGHSS